VSNFADENTTAQRRHDFTDSVGSGISNDYQGCLDEDLVLSRPEVYRWSLNLQASTSPRPAVKESQAFTTRILIEIELGISRSETTFPSKRSNLRQGAVSSV
jgi:hypothetical protein